jgi:hypothetical protein
MAAEQTVPAQPATEGPRADDPRIAPALLRYRVMAYVVGTLLVLLAGTVPFLSFVAERKVTGRMRAGRRV